LDKRSEQEFLDFVSARTQTLFRTAYALTGHQQSAEDLLQTALTKTAARWSHFRGDAEPYVKRVMYHEQVSWWRRKRVRETSVAMVPDRAGGSDGTHAPLLRLMLQRALLQLAPRQRAVLVLRYLEDQSEQQVAQIMGCTPSTVGSQAARALARLREIAPELRELLTPEEARA
jgi:RNA polymerase sigma-70 factor (sigma-E family)